MEATTTSTTPKVYVASLSDYNAGRLHGVWIDANQDADDIQEAVKAMLAKSPESKVCQRCGITSAEHARPTSDDGPLTPDAHQPLTFPAEEWAIHDYEGFGRMQLSEYTSFETVSMLGRAITEHGEAFAAYVAHEGSDYATVEGFEEAYAGQFDSEVAYAEQLAEDTGMWNEDMPMASYIDWEKFARTLFMGDYYSVEADDGGVYVFSHC